ncbi:hypothetical protein [Candidatus Paracaedibacter symbiosus]|uniref:hypothetical protein n=1 Tax=Candidatus Paracaedibacter symbiosus TaxID=244582 RepID=UPI000509DE55|nr:hypothetical protein [Candidatus Paracaedibacter symbiosus]
MRKLSIIIATISLILAISSPIFAGPKLSISKDAKARKEYICNGGFTKDAQLGEGVRKLLNNNMIELKKRFCDRTTFHCTNSGSLFGRNTGVCDAADVCQKDYLKVACQIACIDKRSPDQKSQKILNNLSKCLVAQPQETKTETQQNSWTPTHSGQRASSSLRQDTSGTQRQHGQIGASRTHSLNERPVPPVPSSSLSENPIPPIPSSIEIATPETIPLTPLSPEPSVKRKFNELENPSYGRPAPHKIPRINEDNYLKSRLNAIRNDVAADEEDEEENNDYEMYDAPAAPDSSLRASVKSRYSIRTDSSQANGQPEAENRNALHEQIREGKQLRKVERNSTKNISSNMAGIYGQMAKTIEAHNNSHTDQNTSKESNDNEWLEESNGNE